MRQVIDDRFELVSLLGEGAYGEVHRARDRATGRHVAIKILKERPDRPEQLERFLREGELTARLSHPGILRVHSAGTVDGRPYLACELVEGCLELGDAFLERVLVERAELVAQAAHALGHAHAQGIVHRDVKPANVLVDRHGRVRVADFGLAQAWDSERLTRTGAVVGTPLYLSPEQVKGHQTTPQSDVWALGLLLYEALTGELPWTAGNVQGLLGQILQLRVPSPLEHAPECPRPLAAVCLKALERDPHERYRDGEAFARDLDRALAGDAVEAKPTPSFLRPHVLAPLIGATLAVVVLAVAVRGGASAAAIRWSEPARLDWGGEGPIVLEGTLINAPPGCFVRFGEQRFPVENARFSAPLDLPDGEHRLTASILRGEDVLGETSRTLRVDRTPPVLTLTTAEDAIARKKEFSLSGEVDDGGARVRVRCGEQTRTVARRFVFDVQLSSGRNVLEVVAADGLGNRVTARRTVWLPPTWFGDLPANERPPLPLPPGVDFGGPEREYVNVADGSVLVWVPRPREEDGLFPMRTGRRYVRLHSFFLGKHEVTREQYLRFCRETGRRPPRDPPWPTGPRHPIGGVSWFDATAYCKWAGVILPSEAQWEYAARSLDGRNYPWGFLPSRGHGNFANAKGHQDPFPQTAPVGSFPRSASPFGAEDMGGNVFEWIHDWEGAFDAPDVDGEPDVDYRGPPRGTRKVVRGGGFDHPYSTGKCSNRQVEDPNRRLDHTGFRVARSSR
jgi:formylglycine-generating enzyme required for sulfatase activity/tRNA A-37 threonylcarbamoyl transferase component Bud32